MEKKTISELFAYADSIPDDARYDELHEKFLDSEWVRVDDEIKKLKEILSYVPRDGSFGIEKLYIVIEDNIKELSQSSPDLVLSGENLGIDKMSSPESKSAKFTIATSDGKSGRDIFKVKND